MNFAEYIKLNRLRQKDLVLATGYCPKAIRARCANPGKWSVNELINIAEAYNLDSTEIIQAVVNSAMNKERT